MILLGLIPFLYLAIRQNTLQRGNILGIAVVVVLVLLMVIMAARRISGIKKGEPYEDEFSKKIVQQSAARSFFISMYWLLFIMLFEPLLADFLFDSKKLDASQAIGGGIAGMSVIFLINWIYWQKKGIK